MPSPIQQDTQVRSSLVVDRDDQVMPGPPMELAANLLQDLNAIRSQLNLILDQHNGNWHDDLTTPPGGVKRGLAALATAVAALEAAPSGGGGALIYQQGGAETGPVVFNDWDDLWAQLLALRAASNNSGLYTIAIDDRFASGVDGGCTIPASAVVYDFAGVELTSFDSINGGDAVLNFADGTHAINLRHFSNFLTVQNFNTVTPLEVMPASSEWHLIRIHGGAIVQTVNGSTTPVWDCSPMVGGGIIAKVFDRSYIAGVRNGRVLGDLPAGCVLVGQSHSSNPNYPPFGRNQAITADAGSFVQIQMDNPLLHPKLPGFLGTQLVPQVNAPAFTLPNPWRLPPSAGPVAAKLGDALNLDASAGAFTQGLPDLTTGSDAVGLGGFVTVIETGGGIVTLSAAAGDTIQGGATIQVPPFGGMILQAHNGGAWRVVGEFNPATSVIWKRDEFTATAAQITFIMSSAATDPASLAVEINGVAAPSVDYTVSGVTVTWLNTSYALAAGDHVLIAYK